ncbi:MAG: M28 family peptidase [Anaerolineae bacterium]
MRPRWLTWLVAFSLLLFAGLAPASAERPAALGANSEELPPRVQSTLTPDDPLWATGESPTYPDSIRPERDWSAFEPEVWIGAPVSVDPTVQQMLGQVQSGTIYQYMKWLTGEEAALIGGAPYTITTRYTYSGTPIQKATQFAYEHFGDLGLTVEYDIWDAGSSPNVIATHPGLTAPEDVYVICAHLDDLPASGVAPGADDNASGSTAVLVAADILSQYDFGCTLTFALWTGEEQGLLGSEAWAAAASRQGLDIQGVLNLDMIGYNSDDQFDVDLHAQTALPDSVAIAQVFSGVSDAYALQLRPEILIDNSLGTHSDNASFWAHGYPAILAIEDGDDFNQDNYHRVTDQLSVLDKDYFTRFVQASVGTLVHMSGCLLCTPADILTVSTYMSGCTASLAAEVRGSAPITYTWDLGQHGTYAEASPSVTFAAAGSYPYTLTVSNCDMGAADVATGTVAVSCAPPPQRTYLPLVVRAE